MLPFTTGDAQAFKSGDYVYLPSVRAAVEGGAETIKGYIVGDRLAETVLSLGSLNGGERRILLSGCLMNDYRDKA
jgi:aconitate hydratase